MIYLYFVDGSDNELKSVSEDFNLHSGIANLETIWRGNGYKNNEKLMQSVIDETTILTNDEELLNDLRLWDEEEKIYMIWKRLKSGSWARLDMLTDKCLRRANNITKIYHCGVFDEVDEDETA